MGGVKLAHKETFERAFRIPPKLEHGKIAGHDARVPAKRTSVFDQSQDRKSLSASSIEKFESRRSDLLSTDLPSDLVRWNREPF